MHVAVVGHVEWIEFVRVPHVPGPGQIVHSREAWQEPGGGGAVAAAQLAKLVGACDLYTALGDDELGHRAHAELTARRVHLLTTWRREPQRRAFTHVDDAGERTITVIGGRIDPNARDPLPWARLADAHAVYITAGDVAAVRLARRARTLVATSRILPTLRAAGVQLDALVGSATDPSERYDDDLDPPPRLVVRTDGANGGTYTVGDRTAAYAPSAPPGPIVDAYGCGDSFAAGLTYALGSGYPALAALAVAARCGAAALTGRGPYSGQLSLLQRP